MSHGSTFAAGAGPACTSYAPLSHLELPTPGRGKPRSSVAARQLAESMAGLPDCRAIVWMGPPLSASGSNRGLVLERLLPPKPHVFPSSTLQPLSVYRSE